jgi:protein translocase SecG subunit
MKETLIAILPYIQIGLSVLLVGTILLQQSDSGVGSSFGGGDNFNSAFHTRRGFEKVLFQVTIAIATLLAVSALAILFLKK